MAFPRQAGVPRAPMAPAGPVAPRAPMAPRAPAGPVSPAPPTGVPGGIASPPKPKAFSKKSARSGSRNPFARAAVKGGR